MHALIKAVEDKQRKPKVVDVKSGDVVRVHQKIREAGKERTQVFEGLVIRTSRKNSLSNTITVRRIASGVGVEKTFLLHSPLIEKVEVVRRSKVRRNYLSYMRARSGKSARLDAVAFDKDEVNAIPDPEAEPEPADETGDTETTEAVTGETAEAPADEEAAEEKQEAKEAPKEEKATEPKDEAKAEASK